MKILIGGIGTGDCKCPASPTVGPLKATAYQCSIGLLEFPPAHARDCCVEACGTILDGLHGPQFRASLDSRMFQRSTYVHEQCSAWTAPSPTDQHVGGFAKNRGVAHTTEWPCGIAQYNVLTPVSRFTDRVAQETEIRTRALQLFTRTMDLRVSRITHSD
jgi:hypothetical protein